MHIDPKELIAGVPGLVAREILKAAAEREGIASDQLPRRIALSTDDPTSLLEDLAEAGYLTRRGSVWMPTSAGRRLADAVASKPIKRTTAVTRLEEFVSRVEALNADPYFLYCVSDAVVFGSAIGNATRLGDVDVAVRTELRYDDCALDKRRLRIMAETQQMWGSDLHNISLPEREVHNYLRGGSSSLKIHGLGEVLSKLFPYRVLYQTDHTDISFAAGDPEFCRPFLYRAGATITLTAARPAQWGSHRFEAGAQIEVVLARNWLPNASGGPWHIPPDSYPEKYLPEGIRPSGAYTSAQLEAVAESAKDFGPRGHIIYHSRLSECLKKVSKAPCPNCGGPLSLGYGTAHRRRRPEPYAYCHPCEFEERFTAKAIAAATTVEISHTSRVAVANALGDCGSPQLFDRPSLIAKRISHYQRRALLADYRDVKNACESATSPWLKESVENVIRHWGSHAQSILAALREAYEADYKADAALKLYKSTAAKHARNSSAPNAQYSLLLAAKHLALAKEKNLITWDRLNSHIGQARPAATEPGKTTPSVVGRKAKRHRSGKGRSKTGVESLSQKVHE